MFFVSMFVWLIIFVGGLIVIFKFGYPGYKEVMKDTRRDLNSAIRQKKAMRKENDMIKIRSFPQLKSEYSRVCNEIKINRRERKNAKIGFALTVGIFVAAVAGCSFWVYTNL